ncbi:hypothetical protein [Halorhodospira halophila]|uniref:phage fiber-tail adaptor protein n=1 Tax=Halorhodospira halophila TaxID=1053 RepID=UPI0019132E57|nr:hypothetical protein [Halorhodospira halophila]MBK5942710.1 hypothetical protein [Halorhodospira halophila]
METFTKQPSDVLDYDVDLRPWLAETSDGIQQVHVDISPDESGGLQLQSKAVYDEYVKLWLEGGKDRTTYNISVTVDTSAGRIKQIDFRMRVRER